VTVPALVAAAAILVLALLSVAPRLLLRQSQDRLARTVLAEAGGGLKLLTRADLVAGVYRRIPGVLGLTEGELRFQGLFGETELLPTSRIEKIVTGTRLANGRRLVRLEVLRVTRTGGGELEFVLAPASASAWRSHLGLWAIRERTASMDTVAPGRR
jgi:hypothetical protein